MFRGGCTLPTLTAPKARSIESGVLAMFRERELGRLAIPHWTLADALDLRIDILSKVAARALTRPVIRVNRNSLEVVSDDPRVLTQFLCERLRLRDWVDEVRATDLAHGISYRNADDVLNLSDAWDLHPPPVVH